MCEVTRESEAFDLAGYTDLELNTLSLSLIPFSRKRRMLGGVLTLSLLPVSLLSVCDLLSETMFVSVMEKAAKFIAWLEGNGYRTLVLSASENDALRHSFERNHITITALVGLCSCCLELTDVTHTQRLYRSNKEA